MELNTKNNADKNVAGAGEQEARQMTTMSVEDLDMIYGGAYSYKLSRARSTYQADAGKSL